MKWLLLRIPISIALDLEMWRTCRALSVVQKFDLLVKKYWILFLFFICRVKFEFGKSAAKVFGRRVFYEQGEGFFRLQSIFVRHLAALHDEGVGAGTRQVVDVGANVGHFTRAMAMACPQAKILALEPVPHIAQVLRSNLQDLDDRVTVRLVAAGARPGRARMTVNDQELAESRIDQNGTGTEVEILPLDQIVGADLQRVDVLKIDVEGFESEVLSGASEVLAKTHLLLIETSRNSRTTFASLMSQLRGPGYDFDLRSIIHYRGGAEHSQYWFGVADLVLENKLFPAREPRRKRPALGYNLCP